jgi:NADH-ubiquinone oxidoreductase chain 6
MINNFLLDVLAAGAILSGILVITSKNPVIAVLFLISAFVNAAGYLLLLGVGFIGISYIIVYVGAIAVLFLFVIMMINIKLADILDVGSQYTKNLPLAFTVGSLFVYELFSIIPVSYQNVNILNLPLDFLNYLNGLFYGSSTTPIDSVNLTQNPYVADSIFTNFTQIEALGYGLYTYGAVIFLVSSMILLLSMLAPISVVHTKSAINQQSIQNQNPSPRFNPTESALAVARATITYLKGRFHFNLPVPAYDRSLSCGQRGRLAHNPRHG